MRIYRYIIGVLLTFVCLEGKTQEQLGKMVEIGQQLPNRHIQCVAQDSFHFMWIGSSTGFYIFDGVQSKPFKATNPESGFQAIQSVSNLTPFGNYLIVEGAKKLQIIDTRDRSIIYTSADSLVVIDVFGNQNEKYFFFESESLHSMIIKFVDGIISVCDLSFGEDNRISSITYNEEAGFYYFLRDGTFHSIKEGQPPVLIDATTYIGRRPFYIPKLIPGDGEIFLIDQSPRNIQLIKFVGGRFELIQTFRPKTTFVGTSDRELYFYHSDARHLTIFSHPDDRHPTQLQLLTDATRVTHVYRDKNRSLWIAWSGQKTGHLSIVKRSDAIFDRLGDENLRVRNIVELKSGELAVTTQSGIYRSEKGRSELTPCYNDLDRDGHQNWWKMIVESPSGKLFVSRTNEGIYRFDQNCRLIDHIMNNNPNVSNRSMGMLLDDAGILWVGTISGLSWYDTKTETFLPHKSFTPSFYNVRAYDWINLNEVENWLCSSNGLFLFDSTKQIVEWYHTNSEQALSSNEVYDIVSLDEEYYIATGNGINVLSGGQISQIGVEQGLPNEIVVSLLEDSAYVWAGTFNGLSRIHRRTKRIENFFDYDGLPNNEFNRLARFKSRDGILHFGTQSGLVSVNPSLVETGARQYPIVITSFTRFDKSGNRVEVRIPPLGRDNPIVLPSNNKYFQIEVALMSFIDSRNNKYTYFLEGLEQDWRELSSSNKIQYNNLPPGDYTLRIKGVNASGLYCENEIQLKLDVRQHLYKRWYFIVLVSFFISSIVGFFYWRRMQYRINIERMRSKLSSDLHDEIGSALTGVSMQLQLLEIKSKKENRKMVVRIADSTKDIVSRLRDYLWAVDSRSDDWLSLKDQMTEYLHRQLDAIEMPYTFETRIAEKGSKLSPDVKQNLYLIFKEAITNVLKHASATCIYILLKQEGNKFELIVRDDGKGLKYQKSSTGQGIKNVALRAKSIGAQFSVSIHEGTEIRIEKT